MTTRSPAGDSVIARGVGSGLRAGEEVPEVSKDSKYVSVTFRRRGSSEAEQLIRNQ